jgi:hypothetical protein
MFGLASLGCSAKDASQINTQKDDTLRTANSSLFQTVTIW